MKYERLTKLQDWKKQALKTSTNYPETSDKRRRIGSTEKWSWFHTQPRPNPQLIYVQLPGLCTLRPGEFHGLKAKGILGRVISFPQAHLGCACFAWPIANSRYLQVCPVIFVLKYLFLAAPGAILSNYFLGCCGIYVSYTYDLKGTIMQIFYGHVSYPHILFLSSQLQIFKLSGYPGIWDRQILFNNLLVSAQK